MRRALGAALLVAAVACGGGGDTPEVAALKRQVRLLADGHYDQLWEQLHPAQQAIIPKDAYVRCAGRAAAGRTVKIDKVDGEKDETVTVPGTSVTAASKAITVELVVDNQLGPETYHEILVDGTWRFFVTDLQAATSC
jgi:hypothetical protein